MSLKKIEVKHFSLDKEKLLKIFSCQSKKEMRVENKRKALYQELALTATQKSGFNWFKMPIFFFFLSHILRINCLVGFLRNSSPLAFFFLSILKYILSKY